MIHYAESVLEAQVSTPDEPLNKIEEALAEYLRRRAAGEALDFDAFCRQHPEAASLLEVLREAALPPPDEAPTLGTAVADSTLASDEISLLSREFDAQLADEVRLELEPGDQIGNYQILRTLGEGGFGAVYLAHQEKPVRRQVAFKVIKLGMDTREVVARFEAERQALALLNHPHIAKVLDAGSTPEGRPYFVMEYVPGAPITQYADERKLTTRERLQLFNQVAGAIQHAHQKGIIHRDIKPSNILVGELDSRRVVKVIDFGIAKAIDQRLTEKTVFTERGLLIGTPEYMSPEQADTSLADIDTRTDVYSLGVLLYELLVGALPFESRTLRQAGLAGIQQLLCEQEPPKPSTRLMASAEEASAVAARRRTSVRTLLREVRGDLDWVIMKALEKDRMRRYAGASELAADVERFLAFQPVSAGPPSLRYRTRKFYQRHRTRLIAAAVAILLLAFSVATTWWKGQSELESRSQSWLETGASHAETYRSLRGETEALDQAYRAVKNQYAAWQPVWERRGEFDAWNKLSDALREKDIRYGEAVLAFSKAEDVAPTEPSRERARRALEDLYWERYQEASAQNGVRVAPGFFRALIEDLELGTYAEELSGVGRVSLRTEPVAASVHCFRYEVREERLVPLPFRAGAVDTEPESNGLVVERVWKPERSPFVRGDRLLSIGEVALTSRIDLASALKSAKAGTAFPVQVVREGQRLEVSWTPFPEAPDESLSYILRQPGRVLDPKRQFGLTFEAVRKDLDERSLVGTTAPGSSLAIELPFGSYLLVVHRPGFEEAQFPVAFPGPDVEQTIHLFRSAQVPAGFVPIPAGRVAYGGDPEAFQSLPRGEQDLPDFLLARHEVSTRDYLAFVNDPDVFARTDANGRAKPVHEAARQLMALRRVGDGRFRLIPWDRDEVEPHWYRDVEAGVWRLDSNWNEDWPIMDVSYFAALEYAHWLTLRHGRRWNFRLPTDLEWEKAARGVDRRTYVWGNYMVFTFCASAGGMVGPGVPQLTGAAPIDESPFGIRDLAGSVREYTSGKPVEDLNYRSVRGGSWNVTDEYYFRSATINGLLPWSVNTRDVGIRLAVDAPTSTGAEGKDP